MRNGGKGLNMINVLGTGLSGLVGSRIIELMSDTCAFENLSYDTGVDITKREQVDSYFQKTNASWVFHFAAYTDVQGAEKERARGTDSVAWKINVAATETIIENCKKFGKKLVYVDTDYAFDGKKRRYSEEDTPNPLGWYATTKYEGAKRVMAMGDEGLIIRIANPYRARPVGLSAQPGKKDFVHKMMEMFANKQTITAAADQIFVPTFIDDIASALRVLVSKDASGLYHVVGSTALSPFDAAREIAEVFGYDLSLVRSTTFAQMFADRAPAPQYADLANDKIQALGVVMHTFREGLDAIKKQESKI
jgi:dTDP-4-dehydrorhamnose reductase